MRTVFPHALFLGIEKTPAKSVEHGLLSVVRRTQTVIRRSRSTVAAPPIEMLNMNAEKMDIHDAMDKYKVRISENLIFCISERHCELFKWTTHGIFLDCFT